MRRVFVGLLVLLTHHQCPASVKGHQKVHETSRPGNGTYVFYVSDGALTWEGAAAACGQEVTDATLVTVNTEHQLAAVRKGTNATASHVTLYFIGIKGERWLDGTPLVVTEWYHPPLTPSGDTARTALLADNAALEADVPDVLQPTRAGRQGCGVLVWRERGSRWFRIPCAKTLNGIGFICQHVPTPTSVEEPEFTLNSLGDITFATFRSRYTRFNIDCAEGFTYSSDGSGAAMCITMVTNTGLLNESFTCQSASNMCSIFGATLAPETSEMTVTRHQLPIWRHQETYGAMWEHGCKVLTWQNNSWGIKMDTNMSSEIQNALCHRAVQDKAFTCTDGQFQCGDGTCISQLHLCDREPDCPCGEDEDSSRCDGHINNEMFEFTCTDGAQTIPWSKYCDHIQHCNDGSDESNCVYHCESSKFKCRNGRCVDRTALMDYANDCWDASDEDVDYIQANSTTDKTEVLGCGPGTFQCAVDNCIPQALVQNLVSDCADGSDEVVTNATLRKSIGNYQPFCVDSNGTSARCHVDHERCFQRHYACVYEYDIYGTLLGCPDGIHLGGCENFKCPNMYKCPNSYCIPLSKVCDGLKDCPFGEEESKCKNLTCPGLLKCKKDGLCVEPERVCDGRNACPISVDDELICEPIECPSNCTCLGLYINCASTNKTEIDIFPSSARALILSDNQIEWAANSTSELNYPRLGILHLESNLLETLDVGMFKKLQNLQVLDLSNNRLHTDLKRGVFQGLYNLKKLEIKGNKITVIQEGSLQQLRKVSTLDLGKLGITEIEDRSFDGLTSLKHLNLAGNEIKQITPMTFYSKKQIELETFNLDDNKGLEINDPSVFASLRVKTARFDSFFYCCLLKGFLDANRRINCQPEPDAFSSCLDLMENMFLRVCIWIMGLTAVVGNIMVIIWRCYWEKMGAYPFLISNLAISDFLMGVYLLIVAGADIKFRGTYAINARWWTDSSMCKFAGLISTISSQCSMFMLVVITTERLLALSYPISNRRMSRRMSQAISVLGWLLMTFLAAIPLSGNAYFGEKVVYSGVCLLYNITAGKYSGWEYVTFLFLTFNFVSFLFIFGAYVKMYLVIKKSKKAAGVAVSSQDVALARQFIFIVATDGMCWIPVVLIAYASLGGVTFAPTVTAWIAVIVLPINSVMNPLLYNFYAVRQQLRAPKTKPKLQLTEIKPGQSARIDRGNTIDSEETTMTAIQSSPTMSQRSQNM